jgi:hypothetical protein
MLIQFYSYGEETDVQRATVQEAIRTSMSMVIRPVAEILTEMPVGDDPALCAGPWFELDTDLRLSPQTQNRWTVLIERLKEASGMARGLSPDAPRLRFISDNLALISGNLAAAAASGATVIR